MRYSTPYCHFFPDYSFLFPKFVPKFSTKIKQNIQNKQAMRIQIINGPNINLLGKREPSIYGAVSFDTYLNTLKNSYPDISFSYYQSNIEGELINKIHEVGFDFDGIILNAGAYTHTSIALQDAIRAITAPVIEVHISNVHKREEFRHKSMISCACIGVICGFGLNSYRLGVEALIDRTQQEQSK